MKPIRVIQLIDSLSPGGAEMVAVNMANELANTHGFVSFLVVSRKGGLLEKRVHANVRCIFLNKKSSKDVRALWRLYRMLIKEKIDVVHAHSSSFYFPALLKKIGHFKLVWHDHYGKQINLETGARDYPVKLFAPFFDYVFAVNQELRETDIKFFNIPENRICYLPNFSVAAAPDDWVDTVMLKGERQNRIVCLANLRSQKDHLNLLNAFKEVLAMQKDAYLYLIGGGMHDEYERSITGFIAGNGLGRNVIWLGEQTYPAPILRQCGIGVLASESEGLPLAIIEYGLAGLAVVATAVGEVPEMLSNKKNALLVPPKNAKALAEALLTLLHNKVDNVGMAGNLGALVQEKYSSQAVMRAVVSNYKNILKK